MKTCTRCHTEKPRSEFHRFVRSPDGHAPACKECAKTRNAERYEANREQLLAARRLAYQADPASHRVNNERWKTNNPERHRFLQRRSHLRRMYGLTPEQYDTMLAAQGNACALCGTDAGGKRLHVDHDHACCPGKQSCGRCVRGLLCSACNRLLGWFDNRRAVIEQYLDPKAVAA